MFKKKDYIAYFEQLYAVEIEMENMVKEILPMVHDDESKEMLKKIGEDEIRHAKIVKDMIKLIS